MRARPQMSCVLFWMVVWTYVPYVTFPVAFVVGAVNYHLEWFIQEQVPQPTEEKSISERQETIA